MIDELNAILGKYNQGGQVKRVYETQMYVRRLLERSTRKPCTAEHFRVKCGVMALAELLLRNEGKTLEFKRDLTSPEGVLKSIIAFANTAGGTLIVGVDDGSRAVRGVPDVLKAEERLASLITDSIQPHLVPEIEIVPWRTVNVLLVQVHPSNTQPHHLTHLGSQAGVFVRVGSTNRRADPSQIEELKRTGHFHSFDEEALPKLNSEALDFRVASELLARYRKVTPLSWRTLRVTAEHQGRQVPTIGGLLLFGKDRFTMFPDSWIQVGRFEGTTRAKLVDSSEIRSNLPQAAEEAILFAQKHLKRESVIEGIRRKETWSLPLVAIREAVMNAVVHTDYGQRGTRIRLAVFDDRIEIESPGLLPFGLTVEDIQGGTSKLRNRVIGRVFYELHLIEQWGSGIQRMTAACEESGLSAPKLEEIGSHFRVTLSSLRIRSAKQDQTDQRISALLRKSGALSTSAIARHVGLSQRAVLTRLKALKARGILVEIGSGPHDPKRQYALVSGKR